MRICLAIVLACLVAGCGSESAPTKPSTVSTFTISGTVRDAGSTLAVGGAEVQLVAGPVTGITANTNSAGEFVIGAVPAGGVTVRALKDGYVASDRTVTISANTNLDIVLLPSSGASPAPAPSPSPSPTPTPSPTPVPSPSPAPAPTTFKYFGFVRDGLGAPVAGVMIHGYSDSYPGFWYQATSDGNGYYEMNVPASRLGSFRIASVPAAHEGDATYGRDVTPGQRDLTSRRIVFVSAPGNYEIGRGPDTRHYVQPSARFDDGTSRLLGGTDPVSLISSDRNILLTGGADGHTAYIEGRAPGTVTLIAGFWGVFSDPSTVTVH